MINNAYGLMGGQLWIWALLAILLVIVVVFHSLSRKKR